jgi:CRP/FNR family cyclic AMP-dependent transcriptional regulator
MDSEKGVLVQGKRDVLEGVELFRTLDEAQLSALAEAARLCGYPQDVAIVEEGTRAEDAEDGDSLYVIVDGRVRVVRERDGDEHRLAELGPGDFFGEMSLLDGRPRSATVVAEEDTQCLVLARWDLLRTMRRDPEVAIRMLSVMSERLRSVYDMFI